MRERGISKDEVIQTITFPEKTDKENNKYYVRKKTPHMTLEVVYVREKYIKVITAYPI